MADITCPFCNVNIVEVTFAETLNFRAIVNIAPILPGHTLVIPKNHVTGFLDLSEDELVEMVKFSRNVIKILSKAYKTDAFDWTIQEKEEAGQTIAHLHLHIILRCKNDLKDPGDWYKLLENNNSKIIDSANRPRLKEDEILKITEKLRSIRA